MVGVASSNLVAPTKFGRKIKHLAETPGAFFRLYGKSTGIQSRVLRKLDSMKLQVGAGGLLGCVS